jgi:hypothetical protein
VIKNFFNAKVELITTIPAQIPKPEWLIIHFCSLAKMKKEYFVIKLFSFNPSCYLCFIDLFRLVLFPEVAWN